MTAAILSSEYKPLATAVSDFLSPSHYELQDRRSISSFDFKSEYRPYATAISDFSAPTLLEQAQAKTDNGPAWSHSLSFATPESDFTSSSRRLYETQSRDSRFQMHESDRVLDDVSTADIEILNNVVHTHLQEAALDIRKDIFDDEEFRSSIAYSLSFATPESDWTSDLMSRIMKEQLEHVDKIGPVFQTNPLHLQENQQEYVLSSKLPKSFDEDSFNISTEALVVTETAAPFRIVTVNPAWEQLCGFTKEESIGKTLGMLQGPETDRAAVTAMIAQMLKGEEAGTEIINYDKSGRKFRNRLSLGSLRSPETSEITHFVGLLKEVQQFQSMKTATNQY